MKSDEAQEYRQITPLILAGTLALPYAPASQSMALALCAALLVIMPFCATQQIRAVPISRLRH